ncbi:similar to Saccharomyces cerevisiae YCL030C HIS4 Multifunctional enzyme containing phosphoribosyl-ATP pyrophosphatase, phosphoribosyl-AMP cyclohydrolase, and histidinol dehydrogenase activities [Maudiozyma barnettii]|uniref:Histidine biosynthesis trifunctional protein n=1 Tax=Maudiozyma barnettii TaxID=61262 RepID=A0A8H2VDH5_9SACH|nr:trifunctional histidinol dehydrogenase/phosphoribosyl-AMP cyclohydrolase/phosphoribosyl-ATP diphosphatase [Kazachstania barnettii]CAB4253327.1 similar to Saccharomyces cerevisiae YCL030C HIS4 Multifunctional enzyme containing phosphoribosyl-ATP pyrophosphatase, phosphoribosyl-AMP cyclohydrolase, and histidinol dehydrogenase activities [Kazachstania barnettii]CAD1780846.1 similar to Saccharomyces cerevisiae YCL030C HIS4 Multifunctional enzyme containing phosphoribosyl-ATP pyrophosphatase, phosp
MTFPITPLFGNDYQTTLNTKPFLRLAGDIALDASAFKNDVDVLTAVKFLLDGIARTVSLVLTGDKQFNEDQLINLLNNGVSSLFTNKTVSYDSIPSTRVLEIPANITLTKQITLQSFTKIFLSQVKTDRKDGLYTTLVVDDNERCLGLVYSSIESITQAIAKQVGVYYSRSRGEIWEKGLTSGNTQSLLAVDIDCDADALKFTVSQVGTGFCHNGTKTCFGDLAYGLTGLEHTLSDRKVNAVEGSYTQRLFKDETLLNAKIKEEAEELTEATTKDELAWEAADLFYFAMVRLVANGVSLADVERNLGMKNLKITRRKGDAKEKFLANDTKTTDNTEEPASKKAKLERTLCSNDKIYLDVVQSTDLEGVTKAVTRPIQKTSQIMNLVNPIIENVRNIGDKALIEYTKKFDGVDLKTPVLEAPFPEEYLEGLTEEMKESLDLSIENVRKFHAAQLQKKPLVVTTQPGVVCSRFPRAIEKVGLYIPGGTAVLPSTALMLGVPAQVAGCKEIVFASPPRKSDGRVSPEVVYVAMKCGASKIVLAGGAQAVAAMAYGTESVPKVDKILGPGNQFVTAAKMYIQNDTQALCSIDMPAGPSEVLVIADEDADVDFVASDLLSQAEHGVDSQVILVGVSLSSKKVQQIQEAVHEQALALPRVDIVRQCIAHSTIILCDNYTEAFDMSNKYAPEHLILQINEADRYVPLVDNAGSIFVGSYTPESCGDYSSGTNHTLPTYGYARQYSGANTATFQKFITAQQVTSEGLDNIGKAVMCIAKVEGLDGHRNAVKIRMSKLGLISKDFV